MDRDQPKRYSIQGATIAQVKDAGGYDITEAPRVGIIFATLEERGAQRLRAAGIYVTEIKEVRAPQVTAPVMPPTPLPATTGYSLLELLEIIGFNEEFRHITQPPLYGEDISIAIIDSGIRETHEKIRGSVAYSENFTTEPMADSYDHGTAVAAVALQLAPRCRLLNLKVLNREGCGTDEGVALAIDRALEINQGELYPIVINLSLGKPDEGNPSCPVRAACRAAIASGVYVVAAAGNQGPSPGTMMSPACEQYVIAVGSAGYHPEELRYPFLLSEFSGRGPTPEGHVKPDCLLPGENIQVASSTSDTTTTVKSGTSFATPIGSAMIAMHYEAIRKQVRYPTIVPPGLIPGYSLIVPPPELLDYWLPHFCVKPDFAPRGKDNDYGYGLPFAQLMAQALTTGAGIGAEQLTALITPIITMAMMGAITTQMTQELYV